MIFGRAKSQCVKRADALTPAASEQPKRRFSTEKTRAHYIWLEIKDRTLFARFFLKQQNEKSAGCLSDSSRRTPVLFPSQDRERF
ncbi:hypothetical protein C0674_02280 [Sporolactobacillus terrae]|uniref:Uncharacterized protein n=1 Tax=Sporolactobacillus terrae TaxID=269673 RepID=A0ABX5Q4H7_9BACL|nr:hypothetical protein C0674_02280 [Sporolactobacillus terrae]QAA24517.1 hypothetical protein C0679_02260 [Sporolactobacillus terrae]